MRNLDEHPHHTWQKLSATSLIEAYTCTTCRIVRIHQPNGDNVYHYRDSGNPTKQEPACITAKTKQRPNGHFKQPKPKSKLL